MALTRLTCFLFIFTANVAYTEAQCGSTMNFTANATANFVMSANYPQPYGINLNCLYRITPMTGHSVHLMSIDVDLFNKDNKCTDNLQFYNDGSMTPIKTACNSDMVAVQSSVDTTLLVNFTTDGMQAGRGFYLKFWSAPPYSASCTPGTPTVLNVGTMPMFLELPDQTNINANMGCDYVFIAPSDQYMVSTYMQSWKNVPSLACGNGSLSVYDGQGTGGIKMIDAACGENSPFMILDASGQNLTLKINTTATGTVSGKFTLKIMSLPMNVASCSYISLPLGPVPSYIWYPNMKSGSLCPKTLLSPQTTVRVTVLNDLVSTVAFNCTAPLPFMAQDVTSPMQNAKSMCVKKKPTFFSSTKDLYLSSNSNTDRALLRITSFEGKCNGMPGKEIAKNDTQGEWELENIQRNSLCVQQIEAENMNDVVNIMIDSSLQDQNDCVYVYDGPNKTMSSMLFHKCGMFKRKLSGTQRLLTISVVTNDVKTEGKVSVTYYSVRNHSGCPAILNLLAGSKKKEMTSPNYPSEYPLNSQCMWRFVSYRPDFVVVIEVIDSDLPLDCKDYVAVYDGEDDTAVRIGEWCGQRKPSYRGSGQVMTLKFSADDKYMNGKRGFKFRYYADTKVFRKLDPGTDVLLIAGVFSCILVAGGLLFIIYRCYKMRRGSPDDKEPITD